MLVTHLYDTASGLARLLGFKFLQSGTFQKNGGLRTVGEKPCPALDLTSVSCEDLSPFNQLAPDSFIVWFLWLLGIELPSNKHGLDPIYSFQY